MNEGWIKLHRKMLSNDELFKSAHTFTVWCWMLLNADYKTGEVIIGRFLLSSWLRIKPSTLYQTIKRLEKMNMIETKSNNKMTTIKIMNWSKYQSNPTNLDDSQIDQYNNKINVKQQQSSTIQEYKNKEIRIKNNNIKEINKEKFSSIESITQEDMQEIAEDYQTTLPHVISCLDDLKSYCERSGKKYKDYKAALRHFVKSDALKRKEDYGNRLSKSTIAYVGDPL